jgi:hypothetical protein
MRPRRRREKVGLVLAGCAVAVAGVITALVLPNVGYESTAYGGLESTAPAPTTGAWTPITVKRPKIPVIAGGIPVDIDPSTSRSDFSTTLFPLGARRYRMTIFNTSSLGAINSLQWYPPTGVRIVKLVGSSEGHCTLTGLRGFGGKQFPTLVLYPNILCDRLNLKPATCTCAGDGGSVTITFTTNKPVAVNEGDLRLRTATLVFDRIPTSPTSGSSPGTRHVMRIATKPAGVGGLTAQERRDAQGAMDGLQDSNISLQLVTITTRWVQSVPTTCRIRLVSRHPSAYKVYLFWVPWLAAEPYVWLNMYVTNDPTTSTFRLGATQPVLPGGRLTKDGRKVNRLSVDTTLLSRYGAEQAKKGHQILLAHGGDVFAKPGATCEVLKNGAIRLR